MSLLYLTLGLAFVFVRTALAGDVVKLDSLVNQCKFMVDGNAFDLCPLVGNSQTRRNITYERQTPPSILKGRYEILFDGKLPKHRNVETNMQCPDGTAICLTTYTRYNTEPVENAKVLNTIPVAGAMTGDDRKPFIQRGTYTPGLNVEAEMVRRWNATEDSLRITMHGGYYVYQKQSAVFHMVCDEDHKKQNLRFLWASNGEHIFSWRSPHSCVRSREGPSSDTPPEDGSDDSGEEQELVNPSLYDRSGRAIWTLIAITTCVTAIIAYLVYFPPRVFRRFVSRFLKNHPSLLHFRVGENVLVRWANDEIDLEEDAPLFVEGDDISHYIEDEENIPLKPSPRKGGYTSYGTA